MRFVKKVGSRGTLTIPTDVREALELQTGDMIEVQVLRVVRATPRLPLQEATPTGAFP